MRRGTLVLASIVAAFGIAGALRLNGFCLLEPDTPEYLFGARSLASFDGYRDIDHPDRPLHTFRPPGLSLLLVPLAWTVPYAVVPAKLAILALAMATLVLLARLAARDSTSPAATLAAVVLIATSPYTILHATEVVTEVPFLFVSVAVILLVTRRDGPPERRELLIGTVLLAFLPFLRAIGLALVVAVLVVAALDRRRRAWWPAPAAALGATALWTLRNHFAGGPTYTQSIVSDLKRLGVGPFAVKALAAGGFYGAKFFEVLLPGFWPGRPMYERMTVGGSGDLGGLHGLLWAPAIAIAGLAAAGAAARFRRDGALIALYAASTWGLLAVYPPRHERLTWPLVPLAWALVPSGIRAASSRLAGSPRLTRAATGAAVVLGAALALWQARASAAMDRDNVSWHREGERFYSERVPPIYFADWQAAGRYIAAHAPPEARVLTRHSDVGFTSHRIQESIRFEELPPAVWRARIARLHARYLVVPTSLFGKFFPFDLLAGDPAYTYTRVFESGDVAVLEVGPNLSGVVVPASPPGELLARCRQAAAREPWRVDLAVRCAELTAGGGKRDEAIASLRAIAGGGEADVRIWVALGELLLDARRYDEALAAFRTAAELPEADLLEQTIQRGARAAGDGAQSKSVDKLVRGRLAGARARAFMEQLRWGEAWAAVDEAMTFAPDDAVVLVTAGDFMLAAGRGDDAVGLYGAAGGRGDSRAEGRAASLREAIEVEADPGSRDAAAAVRAASLFAGEGMPGRALALLRKASPRFPADAALASHLADVERFFGRGDVAPASF
jgi:tetratricopeptide (TPR) repeat protein